MREEEPESWDGDRNHFEPSEGESEGNFSEPRDTESRPFIERPVLRSARRTRWFLAQPPDDVGESQMRS
jgi:hypothetical protein